MRSVAGAVTCLLLVLPPTPVAAARDLIWARQVGAGSTDYATDVIRDGSANLYVAGYFQSTVDFDPGPGTFALTAAGFNDAFVWKLDSAGDLVWAVQAGAGSSNGDEAYGMALDPSANLVAVGKFADTVDFDPGPGVVNLTAAGSVDAFVWKLDGAGGLVWARRLGGALPNIARDVAVDQGGDVYTVGLFQGTADFDPGPGVVNLTSAGSYDVFVSRLDSSGDFVWARKLTGTLFNRAEAVGLDADGNVYVVGYFSGTVDFDPGPGVFDLTSAGGDDAFVWKLDGAGDLVWAVQMGATFSDYAKDVVIDANGDVYTVGYFFGTADFDPGPGTVNLTAGSWDGYVWKLDGAGNLVWARKLGGGSFDRADGVALEGSALIDTVGYFEGTADFDPGPGTFNLGSAGSQDAFVSRLDAAGNFVWAGKMGGSGSDSALRVASDDRGTLYTVGYFQSTADFDPGAGTSNLISAGGNDGFVVRLGDVDCGRSDEPSPYGILLFPTRCTNDASALPGNPGDPHVFDSTQLSFYRSTGDRLYLSRDGHRLSGLVVDEAVEVNGQDSGLGPYTDQPGVPPFKIGIPIEENLVPEPPLELAVDRIPLGVSALLFEAVDVQREIYGNTSVYLVKDCGIWIEGGAGGETTIGFVSYDVDVNGLQSDLSVVTGLLSELHQDDDFSRACLLGTFLNTRQVTDSRAAPSAGDGYYYLVKGTCSDDTYGDSSLTPDPRDAIGTPSACP